jgi:xanthine dehydrogenase YagR molybdenum-binding subunit
MTSLSGAPLSRPEGPLKVTGAAKYAADTPIAGVLYAVIVPAAIPSGRVLRIEARAASAAPGVVAILTHRNMPRLTPAPSPPGPVHYPMQDARVQYEGQPVALVVAATLEQAEHAARQVVVKYQPQPHLVFGQAKEEPAGKEGDWFAPFDLRHGDVEAGLEAAEVKVEQIYTMPSRHHNPMEPSATIAQWDGDRLTMHDATQWGFAVRNVVATAFRIKPEQIRVLCPFTGGGFGCKGFVWPHQLLAVAAARQLNRPVKLVLRRSDMYTAHGFQPAERQRIVLGATRDGRLTVIQHHAVYVTAVSGNYVDLAVGASRAMYATPAFDTTTRVERTHVGNPTAMRPPQEGPGMVALETAMDELAYGLRLDPLELRLRNYAEVEPEDGRPYSSKKLRECYLEGAKRFGWERRPMAPRSMREGPLLIGWGMASALMDTYRFPASARIRMRRSGDVVVETGTQEIGTGNYAVLTRIAADVLGIDPHRVTVRLGDTALPEAGPTTGSSSTMCVGSAVADAAAKLKARIPELQRPGVEEITADGSWSPGGPFDAAGGKSGFAMHSYGAVFVEVAVDPDLGLVRMRRCVAGYSAGRIINPKTAVSQMTGGIIWGYGQAVLEESGFDPKLGRFLSKNLAGVMLPVNADIPDIDVFFVEEHDSHANLIGARGIGELGAVGTAPAIVNAVYHATGIRVRDLPIRIDRLVDQRESRS